jgi:hypothetical protein
MKTKAKIISLILAIVFAIGFFNTSYAEELGTVAEPAAETPYYGNLKWAAEIGNGWQKPAGVPTEVGEALVVMSGDEIYKLDKKDGSIIKKGKMSAAQSYGYTAPTYADGKIFAPLSSGIIEAFDGDTLLSIWTYEDSLSGKGMTKITYDEGYIYTGFWNGENKDASFVCINAETGEKVWSKVISGGLYWAGALVIGDVVIFGTDDAVTSGEGTAHIYSLNKNTGEEIADVEVVGKGDIRSSVVYDSGRIYLTTKGGYIVSASVGENGEINDVSFGEIGAASTSTPVIYKGVIYVGASDKSVKAIDENTLDVIYSVPMKAYPQCTLLLSTAYEESDGYIYLYSTYNSKPGGITLIKAKPDGKSAEDCIVTELFDAEGYEQYCISDIISDSDGVLYYKNDSGYLFAVEQKSENVFVSVEEAGFLLPQRELSVPVGIAERYGYKNIDIEDGKISALDALVAVHKEMFGDDFTPLTAQNYLYVAPDSGFISRIFGIDTWNVGFSVNGKAPHDDVLTSYGYTGYTVSQTELNEGDKVSFFLYRDGWAMDNFAYFTSDGEKKDEIALGANEEVTLNLKGYCYAYYSCYDDSFIETMTQSIEDAVIYVVDEGTGEMTPVNCTDEDGNVTLSFDKIGKYVISAMEDSTDEYATPIIAPWLEVYVTGTETEIDGDTAKVFSCLEEDKECNIFAASYENGKMTAALKKNVVLPKGEYTQTLDISSLSGSDVKIFIWNGALCPVK